ncbi:MAG: hypothetical protein ACFFDX_11420, partial [Candidatus Odinarchaeota archaeon]
MKKSNFIKTKRILVLLLLFLGMIITPLGYNFLTLGIDKKTYEDKADIFREEHNSYEPLLKSSEPIDFDGNGEQMNITLHQSLINTSTIAFANLDISNNFSKPFPNFNGYSTSFINITIDSIYAPNKSIIYEDDGIQAEEVYTYQYAASFNIAGSGYLENVSLNLYNFGDSINSSLRLRVYTSIWNTGGYSEPDSLYGTLASGVEIDNYDDWYKFSNLNTFLNISETQNNTFFIALRDMDDNTYWYYDYDGIGSVDASDDLDCFYESGLNNWIIYNPLSRGSDFQLKCDFRPISKNPKPSEINLKVNGSNVADDLNVNNKGNWINSDAYSSFSGKLNFEVIAEWWDVSCNVIRVQINYTKSDLKANSEFEILQSGDYVQWNVSVSGGLNYFDDRITQFNTINFTIPKIWNSITIKVFNGTNEWLSSDINKNFIRNDYRYVQILNAGNGTNWYLIANSTNLLSSINTYIGGVATTLANFSNVIEFNASFNEFVNDGMINLSVYSPITRHLNHTNTVSVTSVNAGLEIFVYNWDISNDANRYGIFKAQMFWNNETAAGFIDLYFTIVGDTSLNVISPPGNTIFLKGQVFNITIEYNDTRLSQGVANANVEYSLNGGSTYNSTAVQYIGNGRYNLTVRVADPDFPSYGFVDVLISASETFYVNLTRTYTFHRQMTTVINPGNSADLGSIIRGQNVSYTFDYYDTDLNYIIGALWEIIGNDNDFNSFLKDYGNGTYTMQLDTDFVDVGSQIFTFNVSKIGAETQVIQLSVVIQIIQTRIESTSWNAEIPRNSGLNQTFNFYFNDTTNDRGIETLITGNIVVKDNSTGIIWAPGWELINLTNGWYDLNISLINKNSGWYILEVNASKFPNYGYDLSYLTFYLRGNYSDINLISVSDPGGQIESIGAGYNYT